jgi:LuxR family maltose regulon positive regulatory protein
MDDSIISAKIHIPLPRPALVERPRLIEQLNQGCQAKLTLISAPAGYGKSSLVSEWTHKNIFPVTWLTLDKLDNDVARFIKYFIATLKRFKPPFGDTILPLLDSPQIPSRQNLLGGLINELSSLNGPHILVLDDYHVIANRTIHELITFLIENLPSQFHLMILTRSDPSFSLSRLRARGQLVEIRATNLKFTATETEVFFNDRLKMTLSSDEVSAFEERTEGWITGLQLVSLALQGLDTQEIKKFADAFSGSHFYIVDYLVDEVLNRQPEAIRDFLLHTSILDQMTGALCNQMTGRDDSQVILERLEQENLFLIPLDNERQWYRYHHLFADVLRSRLKSSSPDLLQDLHMQAVRWYEVNGFIPEAISHAIQATNTEKVVELIEQNALRLLMRGEFTTLLGWIEHVEASTDKHPWICIYAAWAYTLSGKLDMVEPWLLKVDKNLLEDNLSNDNMLGHMAAIRAYASASRGDAQNAISFAHKALDYLPETNQIIRGVATMTLGTANRIKGNVLEATQALEKAGQLGHQAGNLYLELGAISSLADILFDQGKLHQAYDTYNQMLRLATRPDGSLLHAAGMAYFGLSMIVYEWGDIESAEKYSKLAIDLCKQWGHIVQLAGSYVMQSRVFLAQGEIEAAQHALSNAENLSRTHPLVPRADSWLKAFRVRFWLAQNNIEAVTGWAEKYNKSDLDEDFSYLREAEYLSLVRVRIVQKKFDEALTIIDKLRKAAEGAGRIGSLVEIFTLQAILYQAIGDIQKALDSLERALEIGRSEEYQRVFLDEGAPMVELLRHAGSKGIESHYVSTILAGVRQESTLTGHDDQPLIDPLSERELELLQLLADGLSNQEIAERLIIAVGTVKAHTVNIYRKLNVNSRLQAVARARDLGLL